MFKNVVEIFLALVFIGLNLVVGLESSDATVLCDIELLGSATVVTMQCRQKRYDVFIHLLSLFTITLVFHALVNICSVCWGIPCTGLRQITGIMTELQEAIKSSRAYKKSVKSGKRKDMSHDAEMGLRLSLAADRFVLILYFIQISPATQLGRISCWSRFSLPLRPNRMHLWQGGNPPSSELHVAEL